MKNGDNVSIETSNNQKPKIDWLEFVVSSKAKNKIKSSLNEEHRKEAENGREILLRKCKNWKIEFNDDAIRKLLKNFPESKCLFKEDGLRLMHFQGRYQ